MMKGFAFVLLIVISQIAVAQKQSIDSTVFGKWPWIEILKISNDGKYVAYKINNDPVGNNKVILQSTQRDWKVEILNVFSLVITSDSKMAVLIKAGNGLDIITLGSKNMHHISNVISFKIAEKNNCEWIAFLSTDSSKQLILKSLKTGKEVYYKSVNDYLFNDVGSCLLINSEIFQNNMLTQCLQWLDLNNLKVKTIWKGYKAGGYIFNQKGNQLAYIVESPENSKADNSIWCYHIGASEAEMVIQDKFLNMDSNFRIDHLKRFSYNDSCIFFDLKRIDNFLQTKQNPVQVDIWSYTDFKLQSQQVNELSHLRDYAALINIQSRVIIKLENDDDQIFGIGNKQKKDDFLLLSNCKGDPPSEWSWNTAAKASLYLVSTKTGQRIPVKDGLPETIAFSYNLSPCTKYVTYYDPIIRDYFSYSIVTGITRNISKGIKARWTTRAQADTPEAAYRPIGYAGWLKDDTALLVYDQTDIFQLDPQGKTSPINITRGYGRKHNIVFRFAMNDQDLSISGTSNLILSAFDRTNKNDGFYSKRLNDGFNPVMLTMEPYVFKGPDETPDVQMALPLKAKDVDIYLVRRMSASEFPNYYYTSDFKTFKPLTNVHPESAYNWLTTELITWKTLDGSASQGILYKPENFNPKIKYPLIIHFYEKLSDGLHSFIRPNVSTGAINIPWFVSQGYLVFTPDIHYTVGKPGKSAFNSIVSAAKYFSKMSWVNKKKMGLQGESFGGYETNYIISHSNIFAAAMSSAGICDFISSYGSILGRGISRQHIYELTQSRIGATLWESPNLYIENSPIFFTDRVKTPLLMMNNKGDMQVPFTQGVEFFTALRRLGRKVWMLQYDNGWHGLFEGQDANDYTFRLTQFFDHYLKDAPAPKWMLDGIPAKMKGIDDGLELVREKDKNGKWITPGPGLLTPEEQKKVDALQKRKPVKVTIE